MLRRKNPRIQAWMALLLALALPLALTPSAEARKKKSKPTAGAQDDDKDDDVEVDPDRELFIRNIVQSATKSVTTVQEAPTVINIVTSEEIENYGYRNILTTMFTVPGFLESNSQNTQMPMWTVRGITQAVLFMKDGLSLFDPVFNILMPPLRIPLENIKRIESTTSPGGVLWGSNSFLGIINVITKDAEDINGLEMAIGGGTGPGDEMVIRPYVMYGKSFFKGRLKVFAHLSAEMYKGPQYTMRSMQIYMTPPRINGPIFQTADEVTSLTPLGYFIQFDGKVTYTKPGTGRALTLGWQWAWNDQGLPISFFLGVNRTDAGIKAIQRNALNWSNSFVYLKYMDRFNKDKVGLNTRLYYNQFQRQFAPAVVFPESPGLLAGLALNNNAVAHRVGWTVDMDFQLHRTVKLLAGGEAYYEWIKDANITMMAPLDEAGQYRFDKLPLICPYYNRNGDGIPTYLEGDPNGTSFVPGCKQPFVFDSDRLVVAGFVSAQWRPVKRLTLDAGVRVQAAPLGNTGYALVPLYSGAAVLKLYKDLYFKVNYSTGFRAPVFNNFNGNAAGIEYAGNQDMKPEHSQAITTEIITKLLRNKGIIREWNLRLDYSYNLIKDRIVILSGSYENAKGTSAIHAVEFLSRLYLKGGHAFNFAYTYLYSFGDNEVNGGAFRSIPNHWFSVAGIFNVLNKGRWRLDLNTSLRVIGSFEDPNRVALGTGTQVSAPASVLAYDRVPASAQLNFGLRLRVKVAKHPLEFKANCYNALNGNFTAIDTGNALGPRTEMVPIPQQKFYFFLQAKYRL